VQPAPRCDTDWPGRNDTDEGINRAGASGDSGRSNDGTTYRCRDAEQDARLTPLNRIKSVPNREITRDNPNKLRENMERAGCPVHLIISRITLWLAAAGASRATLPKMDEYVKR